MRASGPAAELVPILGAGQAGKLFGLRLATGLEVGDRLDLAGPVFVPVLAEGVDEGKEGIGIGNRRGGRLVSARRADVPNVEEVVGAGLGNEYNELRDTARINAARAVGPCGVASHAKELSAQGVPCSPPQWHRQIALLPGLERQRVRHAMLSAIGPRIIHPAEDGDRVGVWVCEAEHDVGIGRKIPLTLRRRQGDARPGLAMSGRHTQARVGARPCCRHFCVSGGDVGSVKAPGEIKEGLFCG